MTAPTVPPQSGAVFSLSADPMVTLLRAWGKEADPQAILALHEVIQYLKADDPMYQVLLVLGYHATVMQHFPLKLREALDEAKRQAENDRKRDRLLAWFFGVLICLLVAFGGYVEWLRYQEDNLSAEQRLHRVFDEMGITCGVQINGNGAHFDFMLPETSPYSEMTGRQPKAGNITIDFKKPQLVDH